MKKKLVAVAAAALMAVALVGCGSSEKPAESGSSELPGDGTAMNFVTGGESGTYYAVGGVIAQNAGTTGNITVTALSGNGSKANVAAIQDGEAQLAFCQSDVLSYAYAGTNLFADEGAVTDFSIVGALYDETVQIVTTDPSIKTVADLKGKNVSIGAPGSGVYFNAIDVLGAYGMTEADITPTYQSFGDSAQDLQDGKLDAAFIVAGAPTTAVTTLATSKPVYLVSMDEETIAKLTEASPYYSATTIPAGTYTGVDEDCTTVSVQAVIIASNSVSEEAIYAFTAGLFDNLETMTASHDKFGEMSIEKAASIEGVPYHPGAAKYFAEKGITVE